MDRRKGTHDDNKRTRKNVYAHLPTLPNTLPHKTEHESKKMKMADTISNTHLDRNVRTRGESKSTKHGQEREHNGIMHSEAEAEARSDDSRGSEGGEEGEGEGGARVVCIVRGVCMYVCMYMAGEGSSRVQTGIRDQTAQPKERKCTVYKQTNKQQDRVKTDRSKQASQRKK